MRNLPSMQTRVLSLIGILLGVMIYKIAASAGPDNGFDLSNTILPRDEILHGGPPRDGIPALSDPKMIAAIEADYLTDKDRVVGITLNGQSRAYPIAILNWHEIVNDEIENKRFAVPIAWLSWPSSTRL